MKLQSTNQSEAAWVRLYHLSLRSCKSTELIHCETDLKKNTIEVISLDIN